MAKEFSYKQLAEGFEKWRGIRISAYDNDRVTFRDLASFFDYMTLYYEPEEQSQDKIISAKSLLDKIDERTENGEDLPPMTAADFIKLIREEKDVRCN